MTLPLPDPRVDQQPWELERQGVQRNFEALALAALDTGGRQLRIRVGQASLTFSAASASSQTTVAHGLGGTPLGFACLAQAPSYNITDAIVVNETQAMDATNFYIKGRTVSGAAIGPGSLTVYWVAWK